jgi:tetratricopeptide (TPR) repeat protein
MPPNGSAITKAAATTSRWRIFLAGGLIAAMAMAAYHNSFSGPFIFDDPSAITDNPTIRHLASALLPPAGSTTAGRPLINLTFALNYALGGVNVWSYHAFNLLVHTLAGLTLFGIVRRTLTSRLAARRSEISNLRFEIVADATPLALAVAVIWTVHPLQTEAVTYISQRAESLMGLFYLLTLYCFIRGAKSRIQASGVRHQEKEFKTQNPQASLPLSSSLTPHAPRLPVRRSFSEGGWLTASVFFCFLGVLTKEIIVTAPMIMLLYDRTFVAGSFREAWRLRWRYYLGLAGTWLLLACLRIGLSQPSVGFSQGITWWSYALTSCRSVVLYCKLAVWPHPLVFYYGANIIEHATEAVPYALVLAALLAGMAIALMRWPVIGFASAWFFVILAPSSSVVPLVLQPMAEHRLYLSLAAVVAMVVLGLYALLGRRSLAIGLALAVGLGMLTARRNEDYRSELVLWSDNVAKRPDDALSHLNQGYALLDLGRLAEASGQLEIALRLKPGYAQAYNDLGTIADRQGRFGEAVNDYTQAVRFADNLVAAHYNLAVGLHRMGRLAEAIDQYREVVNATPDDFMAQCNLGGALAQQGHLTEALAQFQKTVRIFPESAEAHYNFGNILIQLGRLPEAIGQYGLALQFKPDYADARNNLELARKAMAQPAAGSQK